MSYLSVAPNQMELDSTLSELAERGVDVIRLLWSDLHGVARGKDVMIDAFPGLLDGGLGFCQTLMVTDLGANPLTSSELADPNFPDAKLRPELAGFRVVPWEPDVAVALASVQDTDGAALSTSPRDALMNVTRRLNRSGLTAVIGPELEFYLFQRGTDASGALVPYLDRATAGYVVGVERDEQRILGRILRQCHQFGLEVFAANHEFSGGQFEVNQMHSEAVSAADRAFLFKHAVKEIAATAGLRATFMGKPMDDRAGSGFHIHLSLVDDTGRNVFADEADPDGLSSVARSFLAGILECAPALTGILNPTINAFKRLTPGTLAPSSASWGLDDRTAAVRIPPERGAATRLEVRIGDATANPYLAFAALLAAGMDGVARAAVPARAGTSDRGCAALPTSLATALDELERSTVLRDALGGSLIDTFCALKRQEIARFDQAVTDWEIREYTRLL
jgi:glutamine synthetase